MYGTHPILMGRGLNEGKGWFATYSNVAAAQDWRIKNNMTTGQIDVKMIAAGGVGDIFVMLGPNVGTPATADEIVQ